MPSYQSTAPITSDEWSHIAIVIDKPNQAIRFYKNNELINLINASDINIVNAKNELIVGKKNTEFFSGVLDDIRVYDRVITPDELQTIYNNKFSKNLIMHYDFEKYDYDTNVVSDESLYGNHGFLENKETEREDFTKDIGEYATTGTAFKAEIDKFIRIPTGTTNYVQGDNLNNCTMCAWVKTAKLQSYEPIVHKEGVFSFGLDYGHAVLKLGDGTRFHPLPTLKASEEGVDGGGVLTTEATGGEIVGYTTEYGEPKNLSFTQQGANMGTQLLDNQTKLQLTWYGWQTLTTRDVLVRTNTLGQVYEFEYKEINQGTSGYMVFGFSRNNSPGTDWTSGGETVVQNMLLNWHGTISRYDGRNTYEGGTAFENGSAKCEFWRLTVVQETDNSGNKYNDILYEGFTNKDRTPSTRTIYGLGSRMYHSGTITNGQALFKNYSEFYLRIGGHQTGTGVFSKFIEIIRTPIYKPKPPATTNLLAEVSFDKIDEVESYPNTVFEHTEGRYDGSVAMKFNQSQHVELDGSKFVRANMNTMTFNAWIKADSVTGEQPIFVRYGEENNMLFSLSNNELKLDIRNQRGPGIGDVTFEKVYNSATKQFSVEVKGYVSDRVSGNVYITAIKNHYANLEDVLVDYVTKNTNPVQYFNGGLERTFFTTAPLTTFLSTHTSAETRPIAYSSDFYIMIVAVDNNGLYDVYYKNNTEINAENYDETLSIDSLKTTFLGESMILDFLVSSVNEVDVYAVAYTHAIDYPANHTKIKTVEKVTNDKVFFEVKDVYYTDYNTGNTTKFNIKKINKAYLYVYAINKVTGQQVDISAVVNNLDTDDTTMPFAKVNSAEHNLVSNRIETQMSLFSSVTNIRKYYAVVFLGNSAELDDTFIYSQILKIKNNATVVKKDESVLVTPFTVNNLSLQFTHALSAADGETVTELDPNGGNIYQARLVAVDELNNFSVSRVLDNFVYFDKTYRNIFGIGLNDQGQMGDGTNVNQTTTSVEILSQYQITRIAHGYRYCMFVTQDNKLYGLGYNNQGQLGNGNKTTQFSPVRVLEYQSIKDVACGYNHTVVLTTDGRVFVMGLLNEGQLGVDTTATTGIEFPTEIMSTHFVTKIACGYSCSFFLTDAGKVFACGRNAEGQLGDASTTQRNGPVEVNMKGVLVEDIFVTKSQNSTTYFLSFDKKLYATGYNGHGQLGQGNTTNSNQLIAIPTEFQIKNFSCGDLHAAFVDANNRVYVLGYNGQYQLNTGNVTNQTSPFQIFTNNNEIRKVVCGYRSTWFITELNKVFVSGYNNYGQLHTGNTTQINTATLLTTLPFSPVVHIEPNSYGDTAYYMVANTRIEVRSSQVKYLLNKNITVLADIGVKNQSCKYYMYATTKDISNLTGSDIEAVINTYKYDTSVVKQGSIPSFNSIAFNKEFEKVIDVSNNLKSSRATNFVNLVIYLKEDDTGFQVIHTLESNNGSGPLLKVDTSGFDLDRYAVSGSIFSKEHSLTQFYVVGFGFDTSTLTNEDLIDFVQANLASSAVHKVTHNILKRSVYNFSTSVKDVFTSYADGSQVLSEKYTSVMDMRVLVSVNNVFTISDRKISDDIVNLYKDTETLYNTIYSMGTNGQYEMATLTNHSGYYFPQNVLNDFTIKKLVPGYQYTIFITEDDKVYGVGYNNYGQLGDNTVTTRIYPVEVFTDYDVADVVCSRAGSTMILTKDGKVYGVGYNGYGNLCDNTNTNRSTPVEAKLPANDVIVKLASGTHHTLALTQNGQVYSWGYNAQGQLGNATTNTGATNAYQTVRTSKTIVDIYTDGEYHCFIVDSDGYVYGFGQNTNGQLGINNASNQTTPQKVLNVSKVIKVAVGYRHTLFLQEDRTVWATGLNSNYQLGDGTATQRNAPVQVMSEHVVVDIGTSYNSSYFLTAAGTIYAVGVNTNGLFGNGNATQLNAPTVILSDYPGVIKMFTSGGSETVFFGRNLDTLRVDQIESTLNYNRLNYNVDIVCAKQPLEWFVFAATKDVPNSMLKTMVDTNEYKKYPLVCHNGNLDTTDFNSSYVQRGEFNNVLLADGTTKSITSVNVAQVVVCLKTDTEFIVSNSEAYLESAENDYPYSIITNMFYDVNKNAYTVEGFVYSNEEDTVNVCVAGFAQNVITDDTTKANAASFIVAQAANDSDTIRSIENVTANKVHPFSVDLFSFISSIADPSAAYQTPVTIDSIVDFRVAVKGASSGNVMMSDEFMFTNESRSIKIIRTLATGLNANYQLLDNTNVQKTTVVETPMISGKDILYIRTGDRRTFVVTTDYEVFAVGINDNGELGYGDSGNKTALVQVMSGKNVVDIQCGINHTVFLTSDKKVFVTGHNANGHLGLGNTTQYLAPQQVMAEYDIVSIAAGYYHTLFVTESGEAYATGYNNYGQLGDGTVTQRTSAVRVLINEPVYKVFSTGSSNVTNYFLTRTGKVYACGYNGHGQLGNGTTTNTNSSTNRPSLVVFPDPNTNIIDISCGDYHTLFLTDDSKVYACGYNAQYQLGDSTNGNKTTPVQVMSTKKVLRINTGRNNSFFMTHNLEIYATGENNEGELSTGNTTQLNTPTRILNTYNNIFNIFTDKYADSTFFVTGNYKNRVKINTFGEGAIGLSNVTLNNVSVEQTSSDVLKLYMLATANMLMTSEDAIDLTTRENIHSFYREVFKKNPYDPSTPEYESAIVSTDSQYTLDAVITSVLNHDNVTFESHLHVDKVKVFLVATDGISFDVKDVSLANTNVHVDPTITSVYPVIENVVYSDVDNKMYVSGSLYSSEADISSYYVCGFTNKLNNADGATIRAYIVNNASASCVHSSTQTLGKQTIHKFEHAFESVFDNVTSAPDVINSIQEGVYYDFRIVAVNAGTGETVLSDRYVRYIFANPNALSINAVYATGYNNLGQLMNGNTTQQVTPVAVLNDVEIKDMFVGNTNVSYITRSNEVYILGNNSNGQLGDGTTANSSIPIRLFDPEVVVVKIAMSQNFTVFLTQDGDVYGCGYNVNGQYGTGNTTQYTTPQLVMSNAKDIAVGHYHTLVVSNTGQAYATGYNNYGQLGDGTTTQRTSFVSVNVDNKKVSKVFCTSQTNESSYFLTEDGEVYACGYNGYGQLGTGNTTNYSVPTKVVTVNERIVNMSCGDYHAMFLTNSSKVLACGLNDIGQLCTTTAGNKSTPEPTVASNKYRIRDVFTARKTSFFLTENYTLLAIGENNNGELGVGNTTNSTTMIEIQNNLSPAMYKVFTSGFADSVYYATTYLFNVSKVNSLNVTLDPSTYQATANISTGNKECTWYLFGTLDTSVSGVSAIKAFVDSTSSSSAMQTGVIPANSVYTLTMDMTNIFDLDKNVKNASTVNTVNTCLYINDKGSVVPSFDAQNVVIPHNQEIFGLNYQVYPAVFDAYYDYMNMKYVVKCSAYSSMHNITDLYVVAFNNNLVTIDEDNLDQAKAFIVTTNQAPIQHLAINLAANRIGEYTFEFTKMLNSFDVSDVTTLTSYLENIEFRVAVVTDSGAVYLNDPGVREFDILDTAPNTYKFQYINNGTDRFFFNKTFNERWCVLTENKRLIYVWSALMDDNTKYGVYLAFANPSSGRKSAPYEVKYDGTNSYVLPCVTLVNGKIVVAYQLNNGSAHASTVYYNIMEYDTASETITSNIQYTHGTEARDANTTTDILTIGDNAFMIVFNDYGQTANYVGHCDRNGCSNHFSSWSYRYDIQYIIKDTNNTTLADHTIFENNDTNGSLLKVCYPHVTTSATYYAIVWHYYDNIFIDVYNKSTYANVVNNVEVTATAFPNWNVNQTNPVVIESITPDNFVIVWFSNYFTANYANTIYIREMAGATGTFVTNELVLNTTTNYYNYGKPKIFVNDGKYDLFVVRAELINAPNYPVYRYHYVLDAAFNILETNIDLYTELYDVNILPHVGNPVNFVQLKEGQYQESIVYTPTVTTTEFSKYDIQISSQGKGGGSFEIDPTENLSVTLQGTYNTANTKVVANVLFGLPEVNRVNAYLYVTTRGDYLATDIKTIALSDSEIVHKFTNVSQNIENYEIEFMWDGVNKVVKVGTALDVYMYMYTNSPDTTRIEQVHKYRVTTTDGRNNATIYAQNLIPFGKINSVLYNEFENRSVLKTSVVVKGSVMSAYGTISKIYVVGFDTPNLVSSITNIEDLILSAYQSPTTSQFVTKLDVNVAKNVVYNFEATVTAVFANATMTNVVDITEDRFKYYHDYRILVVDTANNAKYISNPGTSTGDSSTGGRAEYYREIYACGRNDQYQMGLFTNTTNKYLPERVLREYNVAHVVYGSLYTVFVTKEGDAYSFGYNPQSNLGSGNTTNYYNHPYKMLSDVATADCGNYHTMLLKKDGKLFACGDNTTYGQLGNGNQNDLNVPTLVFENVKQVCCGDLHTLILTVSGQLYACGYNGNGQFGNNTTGNAVSGFVQITTPADHVIKSIYSAYRSSYYITEDYRVFSFGYNGHGELALGDTTQRNVPTEVTTLPAGDRVIDIKQGTYHTVFLMESNKVYTVGRNTEGQLGINSTTNQSIPVQVMQTHLIKHIGCISYSTYFLTVTNRLFSCGQNNYGQLGDNTTTQRNSPVEIMTTTKDISRIFTGALSQCVYFGVANQTASVKTLEARFTQSYLECDYHVLSAGTKATWKLMATTIPDLSIGNVKTMMYDDFTDASVILSGSLDEWSAHDRISQPIEYVITADNVEKAIHVNTVYVHMYCEDENGLFGYGSVAVVPSKDQPYPLIYSVNEVSPNVVTVKGSVFSGNTTVRQVIMAGFNSNVTNKSAAIANMFKHKLNTKVFSQNCNAQNKVVHFEFTFTHVFQSASDDTFKAIDTKEGTTLKNIDFRMLTTDMNGNEIMSQPYFVTKVGKKVAHYYAAQGMGQNGYNQLLVFNNNQGTNVPVNVVLNDTYLYNMDFGNQFTIYIDNTNTAYGMGYNNYGQLGTANTTNMTLDPNKLSEKVKDVTCGFDYHLLLMEDGSVKAAGFNNYGQLSTMNTTTYNTLTPIYGDLKIKQLASMYQSTLYLTENNYVVGSGRNDLGQLGTATTSTYNVQVPLILNEKFKHISTGHHHAALITSDNRVFMTGHNNVGQLGINSTTNQTTPIQVLVGTKVVKAACGANHTLFLTDDFKVFATGTNAQGQLGDGTTTQRNAPVSVMGAYNVIDVYAGQYHSMFKVANGDIYVTGYNNQGELGIGSTTQQNTPVLLSSVNDVSRIFLGRYSMSTIMTKAYIDPSKVTIKKVVASSQKLLINYDASVLNKSRLYIFASTKADLGGDEVAQICVGKSSINGLDVTEYSNNYITSVREHNISFVYDGANAVKPYGTLNAFTVYLCMLDIDTSEMIVTKHSVAPTVAFNGVTPDPSPYTIVHSGMPLGDDAMSVRYSVFNSLRNVVKELVVGFNFDTSSVSETVIKNFVLSNQSNAFVYKNFATTNRYEINIRSQSVSTVFNSMNANDTIDVSNVVNKKAMSFHVVVFDDTNTSYLNKKISKAVVPFVGDYSKVYTTGLNNYYQLLINNNVNQFIPVEVYPDTDIRTVAVTENFAFIVFRDGTTKAVGYNGYGQLGTNNTTQQNAIIDTFADYEIKKLVVGHYHVMFITEDDEVYGCGLNNYGQLGDLTATNRYLPVRVMKNYKIKDIVCGYEHTFFITEDNKVYACGRNDLGQLGDNTTTSRNIPTLVMANHNIISIGTSYHDSYFITDAYELYVTGYNINGELGDGTKNKIITPMKITIGDKEEVIKAVGGDYHTIVLTKTNKVYMAGKNNVGQLGVSPILEAERLQFKRLETNYVVSDIVGAQSCTYFVTSDYRAFALGWNDSGQLGEHSKYNRYDPYEVRIQKQSIGNVMTSPSAKSAYFGVINTEAVYDATNLVASIGGAVNISVNLSSDIDTEYYYYAIAVTDPSITSDTVIPLINDPLGTYNSAVASGKLSIAQSKTVSMSLSNILVIRNGTIDIVDATKVNNARVFLYYTDIYRFKQIILTEVVHPTKEDEFGNLVPNSNPFISINGVEELPDTNQYRVTISIYSSVSDVKSYGMGIIDMGSVTEIPSDESVMTFFDGNLASASQEVLAHNTTEVATPQYVPMSFSLVLSKVFNGFTSATSAINISGSNNYLFRLYAKDAQDNYSVVPYVSRFELIKDFDFNFNYINNGTDRFFFNKSFNERWATLDSSGNIVYTWSAMKDTNAKYGVYVAVANPSSGSKSAPYEVKYDGTNNYMLPCVATTNGKIIVAYQLNNGSAYTTNVYYTIMEYSGTTISSKTDYTFGTHTRDANSMTDIYTLDNDIFAFVFNDYQQVPYYVGHCHRGGCSNHHAGWYYYYDIQFVIKNTSNTTILDQTNFENNDTNGSYLKVCYPHMTSSAMYYAIVWHYYDNIFIDVYNMSSNTVVVNNIEVTATAIPNWNVNQTNPVVIESITPNNFVIVWFSNYFTANYANKIYIREMVGSSGAFVTGEIVLDTMTNYYNYGKPKIFVNGDKYDLFVVRAQLVNAPNYPVYRYHYVLDASFNILETTIMSYKDDLNYDILPHVGHPVSFLKLKEGKYQESVVHTSTTNATEFGTYRLDITSGASFS